MSRKKKNKNIFWIKKPMARREFLRGTLNGVPVIFALPALDQFLNDSGTAFADGSNLPLRFGTFFWGLGYGCNPEYWKPTGSGSGSSWSLSGGMEPLKSLKDYLTVFNNYSYDTPAGAGHIPQRGMSVSASHNTRWEFSSRNGFRGQIMPHPSLDAIVSDAWQDSGTLHPFLNLALDVTTTYSANSSWGKGGATREFFKAPVRAYDKIFSGIEPSNEEPTPPVSSASDNFKKSVLDGVLAELNSFKKTLNANDKIRLEAHEAQVRDLERRLSGGANQVPKDIGRCVASLERPENYTARDVRERNEAMSTLLEYALKCNLTRVFCYEFTGTQCNAIIPEVNLTNGAGVHDGYSHTTLQKDDTPTQRAGKLRNQELMREYVKFTMQNLATLAGKLAAVPEGDGTLLDNTLMVATSELAQSNGHNHDSHPYLFLGKAGGKLKGNYCADHGNSNNNDAAKVLLTAVRAVGVNIEKIGMPATKTTNGGDDRECPDTTPNYERSEDIPEVYKS